MKPSTQEIFNDPALKISNNVFGRVESRTSFLWRFQSNQAPDHQLNFCRRHGKARTVWVQLPYRPQSPWSQSYTFLRYPISGSKFKLEHFETTLIRNGPHIWTRAGSTWRIIKASSSQESGATSRHRCTWRAWSKARATWTTLDTKHSIPGLASRSTMGPCLKRKLFKKKGFAKKRSHDILEQDCMFLIFPITQCFWFFHPITPSLNRCPHAAMTFKKATSHEPMGLPWMPKKWENKIATWGKIKLSEAGSH